MSEENGVNRRQFLAGSLIAALGMMVPPAFGASCPVTENNPSGPFYLAGAPIRQEITDLHVMNLSSSGLTAPSPRRPPSSNGLRGRDIRNPEGGREIPDRPRGRASGSPNLIPLRYFLVIVRSIFLKGAGLETLWPEVLELAAWGVAILTLAIVRSRKRSA